MEWQVDLKDDELSPQLQVVKEGGPWEEQQGGTNSSCSEELSNLSTVASNSFSLLDLFTFKHVTD